MSEHGPTTPDGRYILVAGRLWRAANPGLLEARRQALVQRLMEARRAVKDAKRGNGDLKAARAAVDSAKVALGERGPVWWDDGAPDYNRYLAKNTPYAEWAASLARPHDPPATWQADPGAGRRGCSSHPSTTTHSESREHTPGGVAATSELMAEDGQKQ